MVERGRFIVFEGGEACGKSTQARLLADRIGAVLTREPGGTEIGESIRALLLDPQNKAMSHRAEALLMLGARAQHVDEVIRPNLEAGLHVVSDRYSGSSLVYQGIARGLGVEQIQSMSSWAAGGLAPDLTFLVDVPRQSARKRRHGEDADRLEGAGEEFHAMVQEGFRRIAATENWVVIDGDRPIEVVSSEIESVVDALLSGKNG